VLVKVCPPLYPCRYALTNRAAACDSAQRMLLPREAARRCACAADATMIQVDNPMRVAGACYAGGCRPRSRQQHSGAAQARAATQGTERREVRSRAFISPPNE